jgi:hypothetical protein
MGLALPCMRVGAVTPRLAEAPAREGLLQLQCSARRAAPRQPRGDKAFQQRTNIPIRLITELLKLGILVRAVRPTTFRQKGLSTA